MSSTNAKMTMEQAIRECPRVRNAVKGLISNAEQGRPTNLAQEVQVQAEAGKHARIGLSTGHEGIICQAEVLIEGEPLGDCVIDSGASTTTLSHATARKMNLFKHMKKSDMVFTTAAGTIETSMGCLEGLRITIGDLTLPVDVQISSADCFSLLLGYEYLRAVGANIDMENGRLWYRRDAGSRGWIPLKTISRRPGLNVLQEYDHAQMFTFSSDIPAERNTMPLNWDTLQEEDFAELDISTLLSSSDDEDEPPDLLDAGYLSDSESDALLYPPGTDYSDAEDSLDAGSGIYPREPGLADCEVRMQVDETMAGLGEYPWDEPLGDDPLTRELSADEDSVRNYEAFGTPELEFRASLGFQVGGIHSGLPLYFNNQGITVENLRLELEGSAEERALRQFNPDGSLARVIVSPSEWRRTANVNLPQGAEEDAYRDTQYWARDPWTSRPPGYMPTITQEHFTAEELNLQYQDFKYMVGSAGGLRPAQRPPSHRWCLTDELQEAVSDGYGPFDLNAFPHLREDGYRYYPRTNLYQDWGGKRVWGQPPIHNAGHTLERFIETKRRDSTTYGVFLIPDLPAAPWYHLIEEHFVVVEAYDYMAPILKGAPGTI
jgi:hypothetical protein